MVNCTVNRILIIIFLSFMFNFMTPEINTFDPRPKHSIEYTYEMNKKEKDEDIVKRKVIMYCRLLELHMKFAFIERQSLYNTS